MPFAFQANLPLRRSDLFPVNLKNTISIMQEYFSYMGFTNIFRAGFFIDGLEKLLDGYVSLSFRHKAKFIRPCSYHVGHQASQITYLSYVLLNHSVSLLAVQFHLVQLL